MDMKKYIKYAKQFGLFASAVHFLSSHFIDKSGVSKYMGLNKHYLERWISKKYLQNILQDYQHMQRQYVKQTILPDSTIWIFWWQGESKMPAVVKMAYDSIIKNSGLHRVVLVTKKNYTKYIDIYPHIIEKLNNEEITLTQFSDILRFALLYKYGGIWMDATVYMSSTLNDEIYHQRLYTIHFNSLPVFWSPAWSPLWSGYFWAGTKGEPLFGVLYEALCRYWEDYGVLIDYLLIDRLTCVVYQHIDDLRLAIDAIPFNNNHVLELDHMMNFPADSCDISFLNDTFLHKLSWKHNYVIRTVNNSLTVYGRIVNGLSLQEKD